MAVRTTAAAVQKIVEVESGADLDPHIEAANNLVTRHCLGLDAAGVAINDTIDLELIERWLAAHFYKVFSPQVQQERADVVSQANATAVGKYLENTHWGQQALALDASGGLAAWQNQVKKGQTKTAGATWTGSTESEQESYDSPYDGGGMGW
jgi:hypothetical protein